MTNQIIIAAANLYYDEKLNPIPVHNDKVPALEKGHPFLYQKIDKIEHRFANVPQIAIAAGKVSDGIECIDFDAEPDQGDIAEIYKKYINDEQVNYYLKQGCISVNQTPSGGFHVIFKSKYSAGPVKLASWNNKKTMIETRGDGSCFIVPPSQHYTHINGVELVKLSEIDKEDRDYLIEFARTFSHTITENQSHANKSWPEQWDNSKPFGRFNNEGADEAKQCLLENGWEFLNSKQNNDVEYWRRPGKHKGISATFGHFRNMFYCFTDNFPPLQQRRAYTPCDLMIELKFDGDKNGFKNYLNEKYRIVRPADIPKKDKKIRFPVECLHGNIESFINVCNDANDYNKDFIAISIMYAFATLCGNAIKLKVKNGWIAPSIFWFIAVGETGTMKTHPMKYITKPLTKLDMSSKKHYDDLMNEWNASEKKGQKPKFKQIQVNDYTLEALHDVSLFNKRGIGLFRDEIVGFLKDMNKYRKGSDEEFWLESFNNGSYIVNRVTKEPIAIENTCINIIGSIQPAVLSNIAKEREGNGLIERFLFTVAEDNIHHLKDSEIPVEWEKWWEEIITSFDAYCRIDDANGMMLTMTDESFKLLQQCDINLTEIQLSDNETSAIKNYISKIKTYMPRFVLLLSVIDTFMEGVLPEIEPRHVDNAYRICNYFIEAAKTVFDEAEQKNEIKSVADNLRGKTKAEMIVALIDKGFKQKDVAKYIKSPASYVSKVINDNKKEIRK